MSAGCQRLAIEHSASITATHSYFTNTSGLIHRKRVFFSGKVVGVVLEPNVHATAKMFKVSSFKFEVEKFNRKGKFGHRQKKVKAILVQKGLHKSVNGKLNKTSSISNKN
uniref:Uncharacterized protein n=1 Tax=Ananas comosus var. bracteatus TaxID=296719 RepID=A0A6V7Q3W3_ANACO|nr:unnamed protein product [Ananas comosus var. bracteatus]